MQLLAKYVTNLKNGKVQHCRRTYILSTDSPISTCIIIGRTDGPTCFFYACVTATAITMVGWVWGKNDESHSIDNLARHID